MAPTAELSDVRSILDIDAQTTVAGTPAEYADALLTHQDLDRDEPLFTPWLTLTQAAAVLMRLPEAPEYGYNPNRAAVTLRLLDEGFATVSLNEGVPVVYISLKNPPLTGEMYQAGEDPEAVRLDVVNTVPAEPTGDSPLRVEQGTPRIVRVEWYRVR